MDAGGSRDPQREVLRDWRSATGDPEVDALTRAAAALAGVPFGAVHLLDGDVACQIGAVGFVRTEVPAAESLCAVRLDLGRTVYVPDTALAPDFRDNAWVDGRRAAVRFYASVPLRSPRQEDGSRALGTLCVADVVPGDMTPAQLAGLEDLAAVLVALLERRQDVRRSARLAVEAGEQRALAEVVVGELVQRTEELDARTGQLEREVAERRRAQRALATANTELQRMLLVDGLTGLRNRPCLDDHLERQWHAHRRRSSPLSVLMCDVDAFKAYNDTFGHLAGDECLRRVAAQLQGVAERGGDLVARFGGEEFVLVLADTDADGAAVVAERVVEAVRAARIVHPGSAGGTVTISVGVATASWSVTGDGAQRLAPASSSPSALLTAADTALYAAKAGGRDTVRRADQLSAVPSPRRPTAAS